jgi:hypothetical protein
MQANEGLDIDFSLIIPTRQRLSKLEGGLLSFFNKASRRNNIEAIILADHDDTSIRSFSDFILYHKINAKIILTWRSDMMIRDYNNYGVQCSLGKYVWMLNDDFEMTSEGWDAFMKNEIENFCEKNGDRCAYVMVDDCTHGPSGWNNHHIQGCCCPVVTIETAVAMNGIMPWTVNSWGADIQLFGIFKCLHKPRILDLSHDIKVLHHSRHNHTADIDEISRRVERISVKQSITDSERRTYVERLAKIMDGGW